MSPVVALALSLCLQTDPVWSDTSEAARGPDLASYPTTQLLVDESRLLLHFVRIDDKNKPEFVVTESADKGVTWKEIFSLPGYGVPHGELHVLKKGVLAGFFSKRYGAVPDWLTIDLGTRRVKKWNALKESGLGRMDTTIRPTLLRRGKRFYYLALEAAGSGAVRVTLLHSDDNGETWEEMWIPERTHYVRGRPLFFASPTALHLILDPSHKTTELVHLVYPDEGEDDWERRKFPIPKDVLNVFPVAATAAGDRLVFAHGVGPKEGPTTIRVRTSADDGKTWDPEVRLFETAREKGSFGFSRLLATENTVVFTGFRMEKKDAFPICVFSGDQGKTWKRSDPAKGLARVNLFPRTVADGDNLYVAQFNVSQRRKGTCRRCEAKLQHDHKDNMIYLLVRRWGAPAGKSPLPAEEKKKIEALIADLSSETLETRTRAQERLVKFGMRAIPLLDDALKNEKTAEGMARLRQVRADVLPAWKEWD